MAPSHGHKNNYKRSSAHGISVPIWMSKVVARRFCCETLPIDHTGETTLQRHSIFFLSEILTGGEGDVRKGKQVGLQTESLDPPETSANGKAKIKCNLDKPRKYKMTWHVGWPLLIFLGGIISLWCIRCTVVAHTDLWL